MAKSVADQIVETLATAGLKRVYGIVGDSLNGLTEALRLQKTVDWIHVRHEEVAAFAAGAEAQLTGTLAVCAGSCGHVTLSLQARVMPTLNMRISPLAGRFSRLTDVRLFIYAHVSRTAIYLFGPAPPSCGPDNPKYQNAVPERPVECGQNRPPLLPTADCPVLATALDAAVDEVGVVQYFGSGCR